MEDGIPFHLMDGLCNFGQIMKICEINQKGSGRLEALYGKITDWLIGGSDDVEDLIKGVAIREGIEENSKELQNIRDIVSGIVPHRPFVSRCVHW